MDKHQIYHAIISGLSRAAVGFPGHPLPSLINASAEHMRNSCAAFDRKVKCFQVFFADLMTRIQSLDPELHYAPPAPLPRPSHTPTLDALRNPAAVDILRAYCLDYGYTGLCDDDIDCYCDLDAFAHCNHVNVAACCAHNLDEDLT